MTLLPVGGANDELWGVHESRSFFAFDVRREAPFADLLLNFPVVDMGKRWHVTRIVAITNTVAQTLRVAVDRNVPARRRATEEPRDIVDHVSMPGLVQVLCRPFPIVVPEETSLQLEWRDPGTPPNAGLEINARIDVVVLRRL